MKKLFKKLFRFLPFRVRRMLFKAVMNTATPEECCLLGYYGHRGVWQHLKKLGFAPATIIDIGAHHGLWTKEIAGFFPGANHFLFEALPGKDKLIASNCDGISYTLFNVLLGAEERTAVPFHAMETGSSVFAETSLVERTVLELPMTTVDLVLRNQPIKGPVLLKLDVQGYELEVLAGARALLAQTDFVCMEVSLLQYNQGAPLIHEVLHQMNAFGFALFDILGKMRKSADSGLIQMDVLFIRKDHPISKRLNDFTKPYWVIADN
jgi:FkbM family methyltransferase